MRIIILGQHGSGKSTLAGALSKSLSLPTISTGRMLREIAAEPSPDGQAVARYLHTGTYLPDDVVVPLVRKRLDRADVREGLILEGYPRTLAQAEALDVPVDLVFYLELSDELSKNRLLGRQREDDTEEAIARRMQEYHEEASAVADFYQQLGILRGLDARQPPRHVFDLAVKYIREFDDRD